MERHPCYGDGWKAGDLIVLFVNQGERDAKILAVNGDKALVEYFMPNGTTALREVGPGPTDERSISYRTVPTAWLQAIVDQGQAWDGQPQQNGGKTARTAEAMLAERLAPKRRTQKVVVEYTEANGWMAMLDDGQVIGGADPEAVLKSIQAAAAKGNQGLTITVIEWRNIPAGFVQPRGR